MLIRIGHFFFGIVINLMTNLIIKRVVAFIIIHLAGFPHQFNLRVFQWRLSDSKSTQVFRSLLSSLTDFNRLISIRSLIYNSCSPLCEPFHEYELLFVSTSPSGASFLSSLIVSCFFNFPSGVSWDCKVYYTLSYLFIFLDYHWL